MGGNNDRFQKWIDGIPELAGNASPSRIQSLCSDIARQKAANPSAYHANVSWWRKTLRSCLASGAQSSGNHLTINLDDDLLQSFAHSVKRTPLSLASVVKEMKDAAEIVPLNEFLSSSRADGGLPSYLASALTTPLSWAMGQLGLSNEPGLSASYEQRWKSVKGTYVLLSAVQEASNLLIQSQKSLRGMPLASMLYDKTSFYSTFGHLLFPSSSQPATDLDMTVLIHYLHHDARVLALDAEVIKFVTPGQSLEVTDLDRNFLELAVAAQNLSRQIDELESTINGRTVQAKDYISKGRNEMAKSSLRSRKSLQDVLNARLQSLETVEAVLLKIETAHGDIQIMSAYETSTRALQDLLSHPSLQRESVDQTMSRLSDALADHVEIEEAMTLGAELSQQASTLAPVDEDELDAELEKLVEAEAIKVSIPLASVETPTGSQENIKAQVGMSRERIPAS